jgi:hypothetical protein
VLRRAAEDFASAQAWDARRLRGPSREFDEADAFLQKALTATRLRAPDLKRRRR